jgi:hypothetical protein
MYSRVARLPTRLLQALGSTLAGPKPNGKKNHDPLAAILASIVVSEDADGRVAKMGREERNRNDPETKLHRI